jgi:hypothetical protein
VALPVAGFSGRGGQAPRSAPVWQARSAVGVNAASKPSSGQVPCRRVPVTAAPNGRAEQSGPYAGAVPIPAVVVLWVAVVLGLDTGASLPQQRLLGLGTWLLLLALLRGETRATRLQVGVVVVYASLVEYVFAGWLGVYVYRLENVPSFVPPGHGLVYLAALAIGRSAWAHRTAWLLPATLTVCGAWALWGLTLSPTLDVLGALWFGCLLAFVRWGKSPLVYAGAFLVVSYLEVVGTSLGTWAWQQHDPTGLIAIGNPPSGIAGGYAWFDAAALALTPRLLRRWDSRKVTGPLAVQD